MVKLDNVKTLSTTVTEALSFGLFQRRSEELNNISDSVNDLTDLKPECNVCRCIQIRTQKQTVNRESKPYEQLHLRGIKAVIHILYIKSCFKLSHNKDKEHSHCLKH